MSRYQLTTRVLEWTDNPYFAVDGDADHPRSVLDTASRRWSAIGVAVGVAAGGAPR